MAGAVTEFGPIAVDEAEVIAFARRFDPQPIHTDPAAAAAGPFGGLIASGWHTASLVMRVLVEHYLARRASLASPGIDELRWLQPVRPGDVLRVRTTVLEARRSRSKPGSRPRPDEDRSVEPERAGGDEHGGHEPVPMPRPGCSRKPLTPIPAVRGAPGTGPRLTCRAAGSAPHRRRRHAAAPRNRRALRPSARAICARGP